MRKKLTKWENSEELKLWIKLSRATNSIHKSNELLLRDLGLSGAQFGVLDALIHRGKQNQKDIGEKILCSTGNMTMVIKNLEKYGYITRERKKSDLRHYNVSITESGESIVKKALDLIEKNIKMCFDNLDEEEKKKLPTTLKKIGNQNEAAIPKRND